MSVIHCLGVCFWGIAAYIYLPPTGGKELVVVLTPLFFVQCSTASSQVSLTLSLSERPPSLL